MNTTATATRKDFETVKRSFEQAFASGGDYSAELLDLSTAVAYSVLNKCLDPQRKTAVDREQVSDNGQNPALLAVKRGIAADRRTLDSTKTLALGNANVRNNKDYTVIVEAEAEDGFVGDIVVTDKMLNGFKLAYTGSASSVNVKCYVQGGK